MTYLTSAFSTTTLDAASCYDFSDSPRMSSVFVGVLARDVYVDKLCLLNLHVLIVCVQTGRVCLLFVNSTAIM